MENKETFNYTYSAKDQDEIKAIRKKYAAPEETGDKMAHLVQCYNRSRNPERSRGSSS